MRRIFLRRRSWSQYDFPMRTSFHDWEDKQLVQIALEFEKEGVRVTWEYVARRMAQSKRTACQL